MPFSIDPLSIKCESQKIKVSLDPPFMGYDDTTESDKGIFKIEDLVKQEPITIF